MEILYTSADVHTAIKFVLGAPQPNERRVALVAYIGSKAEAFLPNPDTLEIVCCLEPLATSAIALNRLRTRGAKIYKADRLHMKVYWSSIKGCVICSANVSINALGKGGLKEAGVLLPPGTVDVEKLLSESKPSPISNVDLRSLQYKSDILQASVGNRSKNKKSPNLNFQEWFQSKSRTTGSLDGGKITK